jgi:hypothetical protein
MAVILDLLDAIAQGRLSCCNFRVLYPSVIDRNAGTYPEDL